jgi:hypothetical protein
MKREPTRTPASVEIPGALQDWRDEGDLAGLVLDSGQR